MVQAGIGKLAPAVVPGGSKTEQRKIPMEVAGVPAEDKRSEGRVARREIGVAGPEIEGSDVRKPSGPVNFGIPIPTSTFMATMLGATAAA
jgi:hypothetical protein